MRDTLRPLAALGRLALTFVGHMRVPSPEEFRGWLNGNPASATPLVHYVVVAQHTHPADDSICVQRGPLLATRSRGPYCKEEVLGYIMAGNEREARSHARLHPLFAPKWHRGLIFMHESMVPAIDLAYAIALTDQFNLAQST